MLRSRTSFSSSSAISNRVTAAAAATPLLFGARRWCSPPSPSSTPITDSLISIYDKTLSWTLTADDMKETMSLCDRCLFGPNVEQLDLEREPAFQRMAAPRLVLRPVEKKDGENKEEEGKRQEQEEQKQQQQELELKVEHHALPTVALLSSILHYPAWHTVSYRGHPSDPELDPKQSRVYTATTFKDRQFFTEPVPSLPLQLGVPVQIPVDAEGKEMKESKITTLPLATSAEFLQPFVAEAEKQGGPGVYIQRISGAEFLRAAVILARSNSSGAANFDGISTYSGPAESTSPITIPLNPDCMDLLMNIASDIILENSLVICKDLTQAPRDLMANLSLYQRRRAVLAANDVLGFKRWIVLAREADTAGGPCCFFSGMAYAHRFRQFSVQFFEQNQNKDVEFDFKPPFSLMVSGHEGIPSDGFILNQPAPGDTIAAQFPLSNLQFSKEDIAALKLIAAQREEVDAAIGCVEAEEKSSNKQ